MFLKTRIAICLLVYFICYYPLDSMFIGATSADKKFAACTWGFRTCTVQQSEKPLVGGSSSLDFQSQTQLATPSFTLVGRSPTIDMLTALHRACNMFRVCQKWPEQQEVNATYQFQSRGSYHSMHSFAFQHPNDSMQTYLKSEQLHNF